MSKEGDKSILEKMPNMTKTYIRFFEDGGGEVIKVNYDYYVLFEVPQYGGEPRYEGTFHKSKLDDLIDLVYSWT